MAQAAHGRHSEPWRRCWWRWRWSGRQAAAAQGTSPPAPAAQAPLTFRAALDLAMANNLELAAVRRARAIREAEVRAAGQWANPEFSAEITSDTPHGDLAIGYPRGHRRRAFAPRRRGEGRARDGRRRRGDAHSRTCAAESASPSTACWRPTSRLALADSVLKVAERVKDVAQARFEEGAAPRLDVMEAELGVVRARADMDLARSVAARLAGRSQRAPEPAAGDDR